MRFRSQKYSKTRFRAADATPPRPNADSDETKIDRPGSPTQQLNSCLWDAMGQKSTASNNRPPAHRSRQLRRLLPQLGVAIDFVDAAALPAAAVIETIVRSRIRSLPSRLKIFCKKPCYL